ncbi:MAG: PilN domain-containing protein [Candidatus Omnitrophica bacterium]|nr:PilN domain-containing protein [Candidatus Omnitrophota bacterium]MDD5573784.1 PilN domain-containing protein [Candidatus Omnitrophota bacterium]
MITINLLPRQFRKAERKIVLPYKTYLILGFVGLVLFHLLLFGLASMKKIQVMALRGNLNKISVQAKEAAKTKAEIKGMEAKVNALKTVVTRHVSFTELLSGLSAAVPKGLWMERFSLSGSTLMIQGTVISLTQNEMTIIGKFLQNLKNNKTFAEAFSRIELGSVQRRSIKTYDVVDYILNGELKK